MIATTTDIERRLMGLAMLDRDQWKRISNLLADVTLADPLARRAFSAMRYLDDEGFAPGLVQVTSRIAEDQAGLPAGWWSDLAGFVGTAAMPHEVEWYVTKVADAFWRREVEAWTNRISSTDDEDEKAELISCPPPKPIALAPVLDWKDSVVAWGRDLELRMRGLGEKRPTHGIFFADECTGGLHRGDLEIVAAETGGGKTLFMLQAGDNVSNAGFGVIYASYEMPIDSIICRLVARNAGVEPRELRKEMPDSKILPSVGRSILAMAKRNFVFMESPSFAELESAINTSQARLVLFDYIQRAAEYGQSREQEVSKVASTLKGIALRTGCSIIAGSQLNDDGRLRESRAIGHEADAIFVVSPTQAKVLKNRHGEAGNTFEIAIDFGKQMIKAI